MNNTFRDDELLYRAVYPPEYSKLFWKPNGTLSSAALVDKRGLSVERGYYRQDDEVLLSMSSFTGIVISLTVGDCRQEKAVVVYKPSPRNRFHSEIHGSAERIVLSSAQRKKLSAKARIVGNLQ